MNNFDQPELAHRIRDQLAGTDQPANASNISAVLSATESVRGPSHLRRMTQWVMDQLVGLGPLASWATQPGVTDLVVDGTGQVWVDDAEGLHRASLTLKADEVLSIAGRLMGQAGRMLDAAHPCGDAVIQGFRVHAVLPPVAVGGPLLSIRVPHQAKARLDEVLTGASASWIPMLRSVVEERKSFMISGGTGAGKTTLLAAMLAQASETDRLVVVEDSTELAPDHPHVINLQARQPNAEGAGEVTLRELVRQALRMRPDRLVVGECRGEELREVLMALNTGHTGAGATVHANTVSDVPARLIALGSLAGWDPQTTTLQAASAINTVIHVERGTHGRGPVAMAEVHLDAHQRLGLETLVVTGPQGEPVEVGQDGRTDVRAVGRHGRRSL